MLYLFYTLDNYTYGRLSSGQCDCTASNVSDAGARVDASQCKGNHLPQSLFRLQFESQRCLERCVSYRIAQSWIQ